MGLENGKLVLKVPNPSAAYGLFEEKYDEWLSKFEFDYKKDDETEYYTVSYSPEDVGATPKEPFRFIAKRSGAYNEATVKAVKPISRLGIGAIAPEQFLFVIPR